MIVKDDENISYDKERQKVFMRKKGNAHILQEPYIYFLQPYTSGTYIRKGLRTVMYVIDRLSHTWRLLFRFSTVSKSRFRSYGRSIFLTED